MNTSIDTAAAADFAAAYDATDLIPANLRALDALDEAWAAADADLSIVGSALAHATAGLDWSGSAAEAFGTHRRRMLECLDRWGDAVRQVRTTLQQYRAALTHARATASEALELWKTAQRQARQAQSWYRPPASLAANADTLRRQLQASMARTRARASTLLGQARDGLADAGQQAATTVEHARDVVRDTPLPDLAEGTPTAPTMPAQAGVSDGADSDWSGRTITVQAPHEGVHDTLSRIAARVLGDARRWPEIYRLNVGHRVGPEAILTDPNLLQPGWILRLPPIPPGHLASACEPAGAGTPDGQGGAACASGHHAGHHMVPAPQREPGSSPTGIPGHPDSGLPGGSAAGLATPAPSTPSTPRPAPDGRPTPTTPPPTPDTSPHPMPQPHPGHPASPSPPVSGAPAVPGPVAHTTDHSVHAGGGLVLAGGVLATLAAAALAVGAHRRAPARRSIDAPGAESTAAEPVVYRVTTHAPAPPGPPGHGPASTQSITPAPPHPTAGTAAAPGADRAGPVPVPFAYRDGRAVLIDIAATLGLGLVGAGARDAARALLLSTLATHPRATAILADADRHRLLATRPPTTHHTSAARGHGAPPTGQRVGTGRVRVADRLSGVLDHVEAELLTRTRLLQDSHGQITPPPLLVITTVPADTRRLQAVADLGAGLGITVVVLGRWPAGITCVLGADGRVTQARGQGARAWQLPGVRAFTAGAGDTADLVALLASAPDSARAGPRSQRAPSNSAAVGTVGDNRADAGRDSPPSIAHTPGDQAPAAAGTAASSRVTTRLRGPDEPPHARRPPAPTDHSTVDAGVAFSAQDQAARWVSVPGQITSRLAAMDNTPDPPTPDPPPPGAAGPADGQQSSERDTAAPEGRPERRTAGTPTPSVPAPPAAARATPAAADTGLTADRCGTSLARDGDTPVGAPAPIWLTVLGPVQVRWNPSAPQPASDAAGQDHQIREITGSLGPRQRELVVFLAVHRTGVTRDALAAALWPAGRPARPTNALNAILARLRRALAAITDGVVTEILLAGDGRYQLDPAVVEVDLWHFVDAVAAQRSATTQTDRIRAYRRVVAAYGGTLGEGVDAAWLEAEADATRRDAIDAFAALARALVEYDPAQTLELLETARTRDPYNELLYRDIMRLQDRLGRHDAIGRTLTQLTKRLAEVNDTPSRQTVELATRLQARQATVADLRGGPVSAGGSPVTGSASTLSPRVAHPAAGPHHGDAPHR